MQSTAHFLNNCRLIAKILSKFGLCINPKCFIFYQNWFLIRMSRRDLKTYPVIRPLLPITLTCLFVCRTLSMALSSLLYWFCWLIIILWRKYFSVILFIFVTNFYLLTIYLNDYYSNMMFVSYVLLKNILKIRNVTPMDHILCWLVYSWRVNLCHAIIAVMQSFQHRNCIPNDGVIWNGSYLLD